MRPDKARALQTRRTSLAVVQHGTTVSESGPGPGSGSGLGFVPLALAHSSSFRLRYSCACAASFTSTWTRSTRRWSSGQTELRASRCRRGRPEGAEWCRLELRGAAFGVRSAMSMARAVRLCPSWPSSADFAKYGPSRPRVQPVPAPSRRLWSRSRSTRRISMSPKTPGASRSQSTWPGA